MHELSIAQAILDVAERHARGRRVSVVEVHVGALRQVVPDALAFAWELSTPGTALDGARLELHEVGAAGRCRACGEETALPEPPLHCRACGSWDVVVTSGEELRVDALELEDEPVTSGGVGR